LALSARLRNSDGTSFPLVAHTLAECRLRGTARAPSTRSFPFEWRAATLEGAHPSGTFLHLPLNDSGFFDAGHPLTDREPQHPGTLFPIADVALAFTLALFEALQPRAAHRRARTTGRDSLASACTALPLWVAWRKSSQRSDQPRAEMARILLFTLCRMRDISARRLHLFVGLFSSHHPRSFSFSDLTLCSLLGYIAAMGLPKYQLQYGSSQLSSISGKAFGTSWKEHYANIDMLVYVQLIR
jgi:hypothetical protein